MTTPALSLHCAFWALTGLGSEAGLVNALCVLEELPGIFAFPFDPNIMSH